MALTHVTEGFPGAQHMIYNQSRMQLEGSSMAEYRAALEELSVAYGRNLILGENRNEGWIQVYPGQRVWYRCGKNYKMVRGPTIASFWVDECAWTHRKLWQNLCARLRDKRAKRLLGVASTTLRAAAPWFRDLWDKEDDPKYRFVKAPTADYFYLPVGYRKGLEAIMSSTYTAQELDCE